MVQSRSALQASVLHACQLVLQLECAGAAASYNETAMHPSNPSVALLGLASHFYHKLVV